MHGDRPALQRNPFVTAPASTRLLSLDVMRGLTIILMVVVNTAAWFGVRDDTATFSFLLHAKWAGVTFADVVFPFFILIVGVSIPLSGVADRRQDGVNGALVARLLRRAAILFAIGLALNAMALLSSGGDTLRIPGVLQRIAVVFFVASLLYACLPQRALVAVVVVSLFGYWRLAYLDVPDGTPVDLLQPGADFISWVDRQVLGEAAYVSGPRGYDPEGLLDTIPAIAQALIGVLVGSWMRTHGDRERAFRGMLSAGVALSLLGWAWGLSFPMVKALWTSSFAVYTSGLGLVLFAVLYWLVDNRGYRSAWLVPCQSFGINSITAYVLHILLTGMLMSAGLLPLCYELAAPVVGPRPASLAPIAMVLLLTWLPLRALHVRQIVIKV
ncbi:MAG: heparan-alpha-glucosaminide N-acetyltransferase domain-containing protein [Halioglobus sp.]|nr:heparan-alpha-glucosaminide N-acetyltransferase domain-containing protein [Halioglobus sp.]